MRHSILNRRSLFNKHCCVCVHVCNVWRNYKVYSLRIQTPKIFLVSFLSSGGTSTGEPVCLSVFRKKFLKKVNETST